MLQSLSLFMHFFDRIVEHLIEKCLNQPMVTHHLDCSPFPRSRQPYPAMPLILDQRRGRSCQFLQHVRNRSRGPLRGGLTVPCWSRAALPAHLVPKLLSNSCRPIQYWGWVYVLPRSEEHTSELQS